MDSLAHKPVSVFYPRLILGTILFTTLVYPTLLQPYLNRLWTYLYNSSFYRFSGIETMETLGCYITFEPLYTYHFGHNPQLRIDARGGPIRTKPNGKPRVPRMQRPKDRLSELWIYAAPLLSMDFLMIKKFAGVPLDDIRRSGGYPGLDELKRLGDISPYFLRPTLHRFTLESPLQLVRALPPAPPTSRRLVSELLIALFLYDALFFFIHIAFHKISFLARIHRPHHTHAEIHPQV